MDMNQPLNFMPTRSGCQLQWSLRHWVSTLSISPPPCHWYSSLLLGFICCCRCVRDLCSLRSLTRVPRPIFGVVRDSVSFELWIHLVASSLVFEIQLFVLAFSQDTQVVNQLSRLLQEWLVRECSSCRWLCVVGDANVSEFRDWNNESRNTTTTTKPFSPKQVGVG
jgi:hypothetical protein